MKKIKLTFIIAITLFAAFLLASCSVFGGTPASTTAHNETFASGVEIVPIPDQTVYVYYDFDGNGACDEGVILNLRREPDKSTEIALKLPGGTELTRTGIYYNNGKSGAGWSRVVYQGEVYYAPNDWLSKSK